VDADRFPVLVVDEVDLGQTDNHRFTVTHLVLGLDAAANDLPGRYAVNLFRPWPHEFDAAAGHDRHSDGH